jgi:autotransporter-associated beta strand protein
VVKNAAVNGAGSYTGVLVPSGYSSANYNITYQNGDYTIVPAQTLLIRVSATTVTYGDVTTTSAPAYTYTAQYLPASTAQNPSPVPVSLTATAPVNSVYHLDDQVGGTAAFSLGVVSPSYSSTNRLAVGGYDMTQNNSSVTGNNFLSMMTVGSLTVSPKVISATNLGISGVTKVYDGNAAISGTLLNVNAANSQLLSGDVVNVYATGSYADADVGTGKSIIVDVVLKTPAGQINDANNYSLSSTRVTGNLGAITQLAQVTWTGGGTNSNWSNPSNWAGSATPTFSYGANVPNVVNVVIPAGANVIYDSNVIGNSGSSIANNGTITFVRSNNFNFTDNVSGSGVIAQSGTGVLTISGNNTFTGGVNVSAGQSVVAGSSSALGSGLLTSSGGIFSVAQGVTLPNLTVNGPVTLASDITTSGPQIYNGTVALGTSITLNAGSSSVTFNDNVGNVGVTYAAYLAQHGSGIYNLTVLADTLNMNANVTTYGTQTYGDSAAPIKVIIGDNGNNGTTRVLISEDPAITFYGSINDVTPNTHDLILKSVAYLSTQVPFVELRGNIGDLKALKSLTVSTGMQETVGTPLFADIAQAQFVGAISLLGNVTTLNNQEYTANQITVGDISSASSYLFTSTKGRVIFNTAAGSNVVPTLVTGNFYKILDTYTASLGSGSISSALVLSEINRSQVAANDGFNNLRKVGNGGSSTGTGSLEILCVQYDDDGNCRLDD